MKRVVEEEEEEEGAKKLTVTLRGEEGRRCTKAAMLPIRRGNR